MKLDENNLNSKVYVAGHRGMVGSALVKELKFQGYKNIVTRTHSDLDLTNQSEVEEFFKSEKPEVVYLAAAKVGGIYANKTFPADFIYQNLMIQTNVIHQAFLNGVKKLLFLGSSCIYPKYAPQPIKEDALLTGLLEPTNEPYAVAKIAGIKMIESYNKQYCESHEIDYRSIMPTNLYGPGDNYHPENSHVIPGLIQRFHNAKISKKTEVLIWGSGKPMREFLFVEDLSKAAIYFLNLEKNLLKKKGTEILMNYMNVGYGEDISIKELAELIANVVGYHGKINFDLSKDDGTPKKLLNTEMIKSLGWLPKSNLQDGLLVTYNSYLSELNYK